MSKFVDFEFCRLPATPHGFDEIKFKAGDPKQQTLYSVNKTPNMKSLLTYAEATDEIKKPNYARFVPEGCMFIDFDDPYEAEEMKRIILKAKLKCLILKTQHGYHFLFRTPTFYTTDASKRVNWFGYRFDSKGTKFGDTKSLPVQIMRVCGMEREEYTSWDLESVLPAKIDIEKLDVLPYWLWGKGSTEDLFKYGETKTEKYKITDTPFTRLMKMSEGGRHDYIFKYCRTFAAFNGFSLDDFKTIIKLIHDEYLVKIGTPMPDSDLLGDVDKKWDEYIATLTSGGYSFDEETRTWLKAGKKIEEKIDERRAAEYLYNELDFYGRGHKADGTFEGLLFKEVDGPFDYDGNITVFRKKLRTHSDQNFKDVFFKEVEVQLMQMCAENDKVIKRNDKYVIVKNKILSCITPDAYDFSWLGKRPPTDVVLPWNWYSEEWVEEHKEDLGGNIIRFIKELSRDASGKPQPEVEQWLYIIAGASMIPANQLQKIVILAGGGQNGKSLYTSLIKLCLGEEMFNESKIFDTAANDNFWGEGLDHGILCVVDDMNRIYNRDAFSAIKGALTGTDTVIINEKFKPKRRLEVLPQIIACTNFEFELYDKSEGMKRRVLILPTEFHIPDSIKDGDLQHKLVLNTMDKAKVAEYKMSEDAFNTKGVRVMNMYTKEKGVLDSLKDGSLAWFANKARYDYIHWILGELILGDSEGMKEKLEGVFSGGFDAEINDFLEWYITERKESIWTKDLYTEYVDWHDEMATGEGLMKEKAFSMKLGKAIKAMQEKGYKVEMKKALNDKRMSLNKIFINESEK